MQLLVCSINMIERCTSLRVGYALDGLPNAERYIFLDGPNTGRLQVGDNLFQALLYLRTLPEVCMELLWIDAICINQQDLEERNVQISLMPKLFSGAVVIAWLGRFREQRKNSYRTFAARVLKGVAFHDDKWRDTQAGADVWRQLETNKFWRGFQLLFLSKWYRRLWTLSETILAPRLTLVGPGFSLEYDEFEVVARILDDLVNSKLSSIVAESYASWLCCHVTVSLRTVYRLRGPVDLLHALRYYTSIRRATDPRDFIYGLLSITKEHHTKELASLLPAVDYTKSLSAVFTEFTLYWLATKSEAVFFPQCTKLSRRSGTASWVVDWSQPHLRCISAAYTANALDHINSCGNRRLKSVQYPLHTTIQAEPAEQRRPLVALRGVKFDKILSICPHRGADILGSNQRIWQSSHRYAEEHFPQKLGETQRRLITQFWRFILGAREAETQLGNMWASDLNDSFFGALKMTLTIDHIITTERGYIGCGVECAKPGDEIFLAYGTLMPFIIRRVVYPIGPEIQQDVERKDSSGAMVDWWTTEGTFQTLLENTGAISAHVPEEIGDDDGHRHHVYEIIDGGAYIHGIMDGEGLAIAEDEGLLAEDIWFC